MKLYHLTINPKPDGFLSTLDVSYYLEVTVRNVNILLDSFWVGQEGDCAIILENRVVHVGDSGLDLRWEIGFDGEEPDDRYLAA